MLMFTVHFISAFNFKCYLESSFTCSFLNPIFCVARLNFAFNIELLFTVLFFQFYSFKRLKRVFLNLLTFSNIKFIIFSSFTILNTPKNLFQFLFEHFREALVFKPSSYTCYLLNFSSEKYITI